MRYYHVLDTRFLQPKDARKLKNVRVILLLLGILFHMFQHTFRLLGIPSLHVLDIVSHAQSHNFLPKHKGFRI